MKVNYSYIFIFFLVILVGLFQASNASAQSENDPSSNQLKDLNQNPEFNLSEDKTLIYEHDRPRYRDSTVTQTQSQQHAKPVQSVTKTKATDSVKPSSAAKEDDALSFNFLYYIIQKFKITDLVDEDH